MTFKEAVMKRAREIYKEKYNRPFRLESNQDKLDFHVCISEADKEIKKSLET